MTKRLLLDVPLRPAVGSRFQPTGFPDIGAATFQRPCVLPDGTAGWQDALLVESAQSMANRLEATAWDPAADMPAALFDGLPYVRVLRDDDGSYLTSSRTEAHRLAAAFVKDSILDGKPVKQVLGERLGLRDDTPIPARQIARAVFALDPFCLLHGVFFADKEWPGQPKISRAVTGFIEAFDVSRADSGGVKKDHVRHSLSDDSGGTAEGYGTVPYHRTEWTAQQIVASFSVDIRQIAAYGLGDSATDLLQSIAHWEIRNLLEQGLRLRTACDLVEAVDIDQIALPDTTSLEARIRDGIRNCGDLLGGGEPIEVRWSSKKKAKA
jgi:CRISPR-associated protein Csb1